MVTQGICPCWEDLAVWGRALPFTLGRGLMTGGLLSFVLVTRCLVRQHPSCRVKVLGRTPADRFFLHPLTLIRQAMLL